MITVLFFIQASKNSKYHKVEWGFVDTFFIIYFKITFECDFVVKNYPNFENIEFPGSS